jgi:hypothetical protein
MQVLFDRILAGEDAALGPKVDLFAPEVGAQETGELVGFLFVLFGVKQVAVDGTQALGFYVDPV